MYRLIAILAVLFVFGLPGPVFAQESPDGTITGKVINGTEGGGSVAGIEVTLLTYINDLIAETRTAKTDGEGNFQFDNVAVEHQYLLSARYMEVDYYYTLVFNPSETTAYAEVGVCETTTSDQAIRIGLAHTIMHIEEESIRFTEVLWLVNGGDRTYIGGDGVLVFALPEGATGFELLQGSGADYRFLDDNRVTYLVPFPPGERQLIYSYQLAKPDSDEFTIPLEFNYPADSFELMVGGADVEVAVTQLAPAEPIFTATNERFIHFQGVDLPRNTVINLYLSNLSGSSGLHFIILWVIIAMAIIGIAVFLVKRGKKGNTSE